MLPSLHPRLHVSVISPVSIDAFLPNFCNDASWDKHELIKFWGVKVKGQGHIIAAKASSTRPVLDPVVKGSFLVMFTVN